MAYAAEWQHAASWASHWVSIWKQAAAVLEGCLTGNGDVTDKPLDMLQIEIEDEDLD